MNDQPLKVSRREGVQVIVIDRPEARNAVNLQVAEGIAAALDELDSDGELRVGVLTGEGGNFSAGMDLKAFARGEAPYVAERGFAGIAQRSADKPLIAAIEGNALANDYSHRQQGSIASGWVRRAERLLDRKSVV